jgi:peptide methionine sulfoxide reductase MsrB
VDGRGEPRRDASLADSQVISSETVLIKEDRKFRQACGSPSYVLAVAKEIIGPENVNTSGM